jgi:hypothetical protein
MTHDRPLPDNDDKARVSGCTAVVVAFASAAVNAIAVAATVIRGAIGCERAAAAACARTFWNSTAVYVICSKRLASYSLQTATRGTDSCIPVVAVDADDDDVDADDDDDDAVIIGVAAVDPDDAAVAVEADDGDDAAVAAVEATGSGGGESVLAEVLTDGAEFVEALKNASWMRCGVAASRSKACIRAFTSIIEGNLTPFFACAGGKIPTDAAKPPVRSGPSVSRTKTRAAEDRASSDADISADDNTARANGEAAAEADVDADATTDEGPRLPSGADR